jgi:hypothetical protein
MYAKAAAYHVPGKNSMTCMTKIDQLTKLKMKQNKLAKKNISSGILAKNESGQEN